VLRDRDDLELLTGRADDIPNGFALQQPCYFASENEGGQGLVARGVVVFAEPTARKRSAARQTPRVSVTIKRTALAKRPLGRSELKPFSDWNDGQPGTELNFKFYRQATNKIASISDEAAAFLDEFF
jgi:cytochrome oxidase assembly protein ShyY1